MLFTLSEQTEDVWTPAGVVGSSIDDKCVYQSGYGVLYRGDCLELLPAVADESIDTVFADPPFNLAKEYGMKVDDDRPDEDPTGG